MYVLDVQVTPQSPGVAEGIVDSHNSRMSELEGTLVLIQACFVQKKSPQVRHLIFTPEGIL